MVLIMRVMLTIRTGRSAPHSAPWLTRVPATGLAQSHPSPEVARKLTQFLWKRHGLIEIGQELTKDISSCHLLCSPRHFPLLYHCGYFAHPFVLVRRRQSGFHQCTAPLPEISAKPYGCSAALPGHSSACAVFGFQARLTVKKWQVFALSTNYTHRCHTPYRMPGGRWQFQGSVRYNARKT